MSLTDQFGDQVSLTFLHPVDDVWAVVSDVTRIGEWSPECYEAVWLAPAVGPAVGAQFVGRNRMGPIRWRTTCRVVAWEPCRLLSYDARHVSGATTRWTFELVPQQDGVTVTQIYRTMGSPRLVMLLDRIARRPGRLRYGMDVTLRAMSRAVDGYGAGA